MSNIVEAKADIQVDIPLTEEGKLKCANEMLDAMNAITGALSDIKDYVAEKKEEAERYEEVVLNARGKANDSKLSKESKLACTMEIISALNSISVIEDDLRAYQTQKKAEVAKYEAIVNISRSKINRGKDTHWVKVKVLKDFTKKVKTFVSIEDGVIVKTLPMTDDDLQMEFKEEEGLIVKRVN